MNWSRSVRQIFERTWPWIGIACASVRISPSQTDRNSDAEGNTTRTTEYFAEFAYGRRSCVPCKRIIPTKIIDFLTFQWNIIHPFTFEGFPKFVIRWFLMQEFWSYDPFAAVKDSNGNIYARGAQDMKSLGIQYVETIRRYLKEGLKFKRTIHISYVPGCYFQSTCFRILDRVINFALQFLSDTDEEIGGEVGMKKFVVSDEFKRLNVGFALDESMPSPTETYMLTYAERSLWRTFDTDNIGVTLITNRRVIIFHAFFPDVNIVCPGTDGHGSLLHDNTAGEKIQYIIDKFMEFRKNEKQKLNSNPEFTVGDVTTVNLTILRVRSCFYRYFCIIVRSTMSIWSYFVGGLASERCTVRIVCNFRCANSYRCRSCSVGKFVSQMVRRGRSRRSLRFCD